ncbi:MAG: glycosyltransferase family 2 protein [Vicinamibacterales bacterium]
MTPALDVVIVSYNTRDHLLACLASLRAAPPSGLGRVFVVDNASTDGSADAARQAWPGVVELRALERNAGFAAANNVAMRESTAALILLLNSDTRVPAGAIDTLVERLEVTGAAAGGPRLCDGHGRPELSFGPMLTPLGEARQKYRVWRAGLDAGWARRRTEALLAHEREVDWVTGACLLVRRDQALAAGLFDERFFLYEEDVDFCAALRARGGRVLFTPAAEVVHLRGRSPGGSAAGPALYDRSHLAFYEKHAPAWAPLLRLWLQVRGRSIR